MSAIGKSRNYQQLQKAATIPVPATGGSANIVPVGAHGSSLKGMIKDMSMRQRVEGATGGQNVAMNPNITINAPNSDPEAIRKSLKARCGLRREIFSPWRRRREQTKLGSAMSDVELHVDTLSRESTI
jgi:hypothetical protein